VAKKVTTVVRLQLPAGKANPAPPVGPALGGTGINMMAFLKEYNERTASQIGMIIPAEITVYSDRSFTFVTKTPPTADLLRKAARGEKGSGTAGRTPTGSHFRAHPPEIPTSQPEDLNASEIEGAERIVSGPARSRGSTISD